MSSTLSAAVQALKRGGVIAYPTEAVFGLGCDPQHERALQRVLDLKQRPANKGMILIAAHEDQLRPYIAAISDRQWQHVRSTWPGPVTWVFPALPSVLPTLCGQHNSIAVRVSAHPLVRALCKAFDGAIVSTSANVSGAEPARSVEEVTAQFGNQLDCILDGEVNRQARPSEIRDVRSGAVLRAG